jgi:hypothetical protein
MTTRTLDQYAADLHQDVLTRAGDTEDPQLREEAFTEVILETLSDHNEADGADLSSFEGRASRGMPSAKLNAWSLSGVGTMLDLFVTRYVGGGKVSDLPKADIRRSFELVRNFLRRALDGAHTKMEESSDAFEAARQIYEARNSLATVRLFLLTDAVVKGSDFVLEAIPGIEHRPMIWDLEKLSRLRVGQRSVIHLDFLNDYGGSIPCLQIADPTGEYRTFLAFFPAPLLARIYGEHGQRLLERNVRAFLQARGQINRGLQKTLKDEPHRFLAYNNGLCCTAADVNVDVHADGHARLRAVTDFQIVNGGQTTASIFHALRKEKRDISQVVVQLKLTVLRDPSKVAEIVPLISQYANSQNKVNAADFSANGPFHHKVEQLSRAVWAPAQSGVDRQTHWYYERARGSYADDRARQGTRTRQTDWEKQNPGPQKFTKTDLAKFELAWSSLPHWVCLGAEKAFLRHAELMAEEGEPSVDVTYFHHLIAKAILFRTTEKIFSSLSLVGYRAQSVAYALAWVTGRSERRLDLNRIWDHQRVMTSVSEVLRVVSAEAHAHLNAQPGNVGEASKKEYCWKAFREKEIDVGTTWLLDLAGSPFTAQRTDDEALECQWEAMRQPFIEDIRTIGDLEVLTGKAWIANRRHDPISTYASLGWEQMRSVGGLGPKKLRALVELLAAVQS